MCQSAWCISLAGHKAFRKIGQLSLNCFGKWLCWRRVPKIGQQLIGLQGNDWNAVEMTKLMSVGLTAMALLVALFLVWRYSVWRNKTGRKDVSDLAAFALIAGLVIRLFCLAFTPEYFAPDEEPHFKYVVYLYQNCSLPVQTSMTGAVSNDWEYYQPPLYYALAVPFYALGIKLGGPHVALYMVRLFSVLLWLVGAWFTFKALVRIPSLHEGVKVLTLCLLAFLPSHVVSSSMVNNDNLAVPFSWCLILLATQSVSGLGPGLLLGILLGLLINTKLTGVLVFAYVLIYGMVKWLRRSATATVDLHWRLVALTIGTAMWVPMIVWNIQVYGSPTAESVANVPRFWPSTLQAITETVEYMTRTFWASSGISNNVSHGFPLVGILLTLLAAYGGLVSMRASYRGKRSQRSQVIDHAAFYAMAGVVALNWMLVVRFGINYGQGQGRFFFPLMPAVAVLLGAGLAQTSIGFRVLNARYGLLACFFVYGTAFAVFSVATSMRLTEAAY